MNLVSSLSITKREKSSCTGLGFDIGVIALICRKANAKVYTCWGWCINKTNKHTTTHVRLLTTALGFILQLRKKWNKLIGAKNFFFYNIVDKTLKCIVIVHRLFIFHTISCIKLDASIIKIISVNQAKEAKFVFSLKKDIL